MVYCFHLTLWFVVEWGETWKMPSYSTGAVPTVNCGNASMSPRVPKTNYSKETSGGQCPSESPALVTAESNVDLSSHKL